MAWANMTLNNIDICLVLSEGVGMADSNIPEENDNDDDDDDRDNQTAQLFTHFGLSLHLYVCKALFWTTSQDEFNII